MRLDPSDPDPSCSCVTQTSKAMSGPPRRKRFSVENRLPLNLLCPRHPGRPKRQPGPPRRITEDEYSGRLGSWGVMTLAASRLPIAQVANKALAGMAKTFPKTTAAVGTAARGTANFIAKSPIGRLANAAMVAGEKTLGKIRQAICLEQSAQAIAESQAEATLRKLQAANGPNSHFFDGHGAQTLLEQQQARTVTGVRPGSTVAGKPKPGSRFLSHQKQLAAYHEAMRQYKLNPKGLVSFEMPDIIGEGYLNPSIAGWTRTSNVMAFFDANGNMISLFPDMRIIKP